MDDSLLICARVVHLAATIAAGGVVFFVVLVAEPAFAVARQDGTVPARLRLRFARIAWAAIALALLSGAAWLVLVAHAMSGRPWATLLSDRLISIVLWRTEFGHVFLVRAVIAVLFAATLVPLFSAGGGGRAVAVKTAAVALAAGVVGSLAWTAHAVGGLGSEAFVHPAADLLHLLAAAVWVGMLPPLALLLHAAATDPRSLGAARAATLRFSTLAVVAVATIAASGVVNTWYLVGGIDALVATDYGRLLLVKIALFLAMLAVAAVNRLYLTPRLAASVNVPTSDQALRHLRRNAVIETLIAAAIIGIVGVLGTQAPGIDETPTLAEPAHHHSH